ncbi:MAG: hypothetical protein D6730_20050 [Bacteroidetes bacterium]|nr:MAG: hypothetical protein D6730_20050 [Bacteroidota bacterium]
MDKQKYLDDLKEIKDMMERSSRFISLSGLSGVFAGLFALLGAWLAYTTIYTGQEYFGFRQAELSRENLLLLLLIAGGTLLLSIGAGIFFTTRKARRQGLKLWDYQTKRLLINLFIPLAAGGILCLMLLLRGYVGLLAPLTLIFYGLALVNASKYTYTEIRSLGIAEIVLGLLATHFIGFGLLFWALGFGVLHIVYGILMQIKYGS